jgi:hypothetical protein
MCGHSIGDHPIANFQTGGLESFAILAILDSVRALTALIS